MEGMDMTMPQNVRVRLNVGGTVFHTSLHTILEGARRGCVVFQCLAEQILGPQSCAVSGESDGRADGVGWEKRVVPAKDERYRLEYFVDADPTPFPVWLNYLRTGRVPIVEAGSLRDTVILETELAGLTELADGLRAAAQPRETELDRVKKELSDACKKLQEHEAVLDKVEEMRKQLDECLSKQARQCDEREIVREVILRCCTDKHSRVDASGRAALQEKVNKFLGKGWQPLGPATLVAGGPLDGGGVAPDTWYQTLVQYEGSRAGPGPASQAKTR
jgi:hypothetical protein